MLLYALVCLLLPPSLPATPPAAASWGVLAYAQGDRLYVRELPDGRPLQVARVGREPLPRWSPTGRWLLVRQEAPAGEHRLSMAVVRRDGTGLRTVCRGWTGSWVGKEDELTFARGGAIWVAGPPDFRPRRLARMPRERHNESIDFDVSPDKRWVAYTRWWINWNRAGTFWDQGSGVMWVEAAGGSRRRKLYDSHGKWEELPTLGGWSPDSRYVFMGTWVYYAGSGNMDGTPLYAFDARTGRRRSVAPNLVMKHFDWYAYAPDGHRLVVVDGGDRWGLGPKVLLSVDARTWRRRRVTRPAVDSVFPAWSPDGRRLAFVENRAWRRGAVSRDEGSMSSRLCVVAADGSHKRRLTPQDGRGDWDPMWCADGRHIVLLRLGKDNRAAFWSVRDDGRELRMLAGGPSFPGEDHWPDSYDFWTPRRAWDHR